MNTSRTIDWEIANLEGGLFQPRTWTRSDVLTPAPSPPAMRIATAPAFDPTAELPPFGATLS
jgi:hypothetical protein